MNEQEFIRKTLIKIVSWDNIDRNSELFKLHSKKKLTKEILLENNENLFVNAFLWQSQYDIREYLTFLRSLPTTNQSYNVIKQFIRGLDSSFAIKLFETKKDCKWDEILKGEIYRICKIEEIGNNFKSPKFFLGYCSSPEFFLPNLEQTFLKHIEECPEFLEYLDLKNEIYSDIVKKKLSFCFDHLVSNKKILEIFDFLNFDELTKDQILKMAAIPDLTDRIISKWSKMKNFTNIVDVGTAICEINEIYFKAKAIYMKLIQEKYKNNRKNSDKITKSTEENLINFAFLSLYYENYNFDTSFFVQLCKPGSPEAKLLGKDLSYTIDINLYEKIKNVNCINQTAKLFSEFSIALEQKEPTFNDIVELPEKFFSFGLRKIQSAKSLCIFNDNPLNERLRKSVYKDIDEDMFALYLIKRHKIFSVDLSKYEDLMDSTYKQMYALYNLEWASKNIINLKDLLTDKLYRALKNSKYSDSLNGIEYNLKDSNEVKSKAIEKKSSDISNLIFNENDLNNQVKRAKIEEYDKDFSQDDDLDEEEDDVEDLSEEDDDVEDLSEEDDDVEDLSEEDDDMNEDLSEEDDDMNEDLTDQDLSEEDFAAESNFDAESQEILPNSNELIQKIFDEFKKEKPSIDRLISQIKDSNDFAYIVENLYGFTSKSKLFKNFYEFFKSSAMNFSFEYKKHAAIVEGLYKKFNEKLLFKIIAFSAPTTEISTLISDYPHLDQIFEGLNSREHKSVEFNELVKSLVFSNIVSYVFIGSKLFYKLENPDFNLDHLLTFKKDEVVTAAVKQLTSKIYNDKLIPILLSRGLTDDLSAVICQKLDISQLSEKNLQRIYSLFYLNPLNFVKFEIYKYGFSLDEHIVIDLIKSLATVYSETLFEKIALILSNFELTQNCYDQMITSLDNSNQLYKEWMLSNLKTTEITLPFFIKFCWFIGNEEDLQLVEKALRVLKTGRVFDIIQKWACLNKLERLVRRIYPMYFKNNLKDYRNILMKCPYEDEKNMLMEFYGINDIE